MTGIPLNTDALVLIALAIGMLLGGFAHAAFDAFTRPRFRVEAEDVERHTDGSRP